MAMPFFRKKKDIPLGLWSKCPQCGTTVFNKTVEQNLNVCTECNHHMKLTAAARVKTLIDEGTFQALGEDKKPKDVLRFVDKEPYEEKLRKTQSKTGATEAVLGGRGKLDGRPVNLCVMDFGFLGGSMGVVVGERVALVAEDALERKAPFLVVATSGGARMHEGALSLMQMAKTSAVIARLRKAGIPYITVLADPCTGGVSASFAAQGDVTLAEPGALIGFAGPRVIQSTIRSSLPEGFQTAEFLQEKGYVDRIVQRKDLKNEIARILDYLAPIPEIGEDEIVPDEEPAAEETGSGSERAAAEEGAEGAEASAAGGDGAAPSEGAAKPAEAGKTEKPSS